MARRGIANSDAERIIESLTPEMLINDSLKSKKTFPWDTPLEFFESDKYCNMHLYPRQRLMLKLWNLQDDFTDYENQTIDKWCKGFKNDKYKCGIQPDIRERIAYLKANDYTHFTTIVIVAGRRFSKSRMSGAENCLADAEMLWRGIPTVSFNQDLAEEQDQIVGKDFFQKDPFNDQQDNSGIEQDSSVYSVVVATTAQQAQETLFSDYYNAVMSCKWLQQYILRITPFQIVYQTVNDKLKTLQYLSDGIPLEKELASMISRPISSNSNSIRGRSICKLAYDEVFFGQGGDSFRASDRIIGAITPATQRFGRQRLVMYPSSPWTRTGRVYQIYLQGQVYMDEYLEREGKTKTHKNVVEANEQVEQMEQALADPSVFVSQLESWEVYEDYKDEAFRPTYWPGWSPKLLTIQNEKGETRQIQANTNAKVGQYVNVDQETV